MINIGLLVIFLAAASYMVVVVWRKIPLLLQVPQQLIEESFVTRPSRIKKYLEPVADFFVQGRWRDVYYATLLKILHGVRLWLLRLERLTFRTLEALERRGESLAKTEERYWGEIKQWKHEIKQDNNHIPPVVFHPDPPPERDSKIIRSNGVPE